MNVLDEALSLYESGDLTKAENLCREILRRSPDEPEALHRLGCIRLRRGHLEEAIRLIRKAVAISPMTAAYHESLAQAYFANGESEIADGECRLALRFDASLHQPHNLMGLIRMARCDYPAALASFSEALAARTPNVPAMINMAVALNRTGEHEMAKGYCELVLSLEPRNPLAWINLGMTYKGMRRLDEAKDAFTRAGDSPMARFNLGFICLMEDDLEHGLPLLEHRIEALGIGKGISKPRWDGRPAAKKRLLVVHEQGIGDTILMSRFYPMLAERFASVTIFVQRPLERLIAASFPQVRVVTDLTGVACDCWCATMSLAYLLGIRSVREIPMDPWIRLPDAAVNRSRLRIGLNWAGNPSYAYDAVRSTSLENLRTFLQVPGVEWISLHKGHREEEAAAFGLPQPLREATDFHDTAVVIRGLDLVISTETAIPNLSAAMGVPTCVLTNPDWDWRWRSWYPGVTICQQDVPGNWFGPIARALEVIRELVARRG